MCGVSGSGKSTFAAKLAAKTGLQIVCPDTIRKELTGDEGSQAVNDVVFRMIPKLLCDALQKDNGVIYDATCYNEDNRKVVYSVAGSMLAEITWHVFKVTFEEACARQLLRTRQVPSFVIDKQIRRFSLPLRGKFVYHSGNE